MPTGCLCMQDAKELLRRAGNENMEWGIRIRALNDLSKLLEVEESKYEVALHPAVTQQHQAVLYAEIRLCAHWCGIACAQYQRWHANLMLRYGLQEVTGDVMVNMRSQQPIGALLSAVKEEEEIYDEIYESWIHDRHVRI